MKKIFNEENTILAEDVNVPADYINNRITSS
jgi:hypothetical protein